MTKKEEIDLIRKMEPVSRVFRALGVPPPEAVLPTPAEVIEDLWGIPRLEDELPKIKEKIRASIRGMRR